MLRFCLSVFVLTLSLHVVAHGDERDSRDYSPRSSERQLPQEMRSAMETLPSIRVGVDSGDLRGEDNRVLQAAVDYIAALGGGTVEIGPGEFQMHDSLHLRSNVRVVGTGKETILRKMPSHTAALGLDGDFGEQQVTVSGDTEYRVGQGIAVWDDQAGGFHTTVATIVGKTGNTYALSKPLMADCLVSRNASASSVYPVVSGYDVEGVEIRGLTIDGNRGSNDHLNGCRGGGVFLYRAFGTKIQNCIVQNYNGDGISFQQSNDVEVVDCISENNSQLGLHPGSGSQRPVIVNCVAKTNGTDGLFLCWRVRHGRFEGNILENNGRFGISIGHKDSDNVLQKNTVRRNYSNGIFFRNESLGMAPHRNKLVENIIEDNGREPGTAAIRVRGETRDLVFKDNIIRDTRTGSAQTQTVGVLLEEQVGNVAMQENKIDASEKLDDRRNKGESTK